MTIARGYCDALATPHALGPVLEVWSQLCDVDPTGLSRDQVFTGLCSRLQQRKSPCVILLEDLHWADEATLDFVRYLARRLAHWQVLLLATFRDDEFARPASIDAGDWRPDGTSRITAETDAAVQRGG